MSTTTSANPVPPAAELCLRKILVPIDFSDCSRKALRYAVAFAKQFDATVILLHVVQLSYSGAEFAALDFPLIEQQMVEASSREILALANAEVGSSLPFGTLVKTGHPPTEIAATARKLEVDLIIISTHGYTGLKHVFLGSTAENVVRHAPCPVLTVREHEHEFITG